jgi:phospholipid/cholesterol/gamma-HCH transport system substrate-binding protein
MKTNMLETMTGFFVIGCAVIFLGYGMQKTDMLIRSDAYALSANFDNISGISSGADVKMSGVKIGTVAKTGIDTQNYQAQTTLMIQDNIKIPNDSAVKITSDGLLGGSHIIIEAGSSADMMKQGDSFIYTQSAVSLMDLLSRAVFSGGQSGNTENSASQDSGQK